VLILGDSGTGKELIARAIHYNSPRAKGPFVPVNCAAIPETLIESELFGHEKGSFTGATAQRRGRIELADGGTFFLDEIAEMKTELQARLLRVLQDRRFERIGGSRSIEVDVRWVAATNHDIRRLQDAGEFRTDLYHRLAVFPVHMPPLRNRRTDLLPLAASLLGRIGADLGRPNMELSDDARRLILDATWPGNIRELANALERAAILAGGERITAEHLLAAPGTGTEPAPARTLDEIEREAIERALADAGGNRRAAAERLGIGLRTLYEKLKRYRGE